MACPSCNDTGLAGETDSRTNPTQVSLFFCSCASGVALRDQAARNGKKLDAVVRERIAPATRARTPAR